MIKKVWPTNSTKCNAKECKVLAYIGNMAQEGGYRLASALEHDGNS